MNLSSLREGLVKEDMNVNFLFVSFILLIGNLDGGGFEILALEMGLLHVTLLCTR